MATGHLMRQLADGRYALVRSSDSKSLEKHSPDGGCQSGCCGCATVRKYEACAGQINVECLPTNPIWICENRRCNRTDTEPPGLIVIDRVVLFGTSGIYQGKVCYRRTSITKPSSDITPDDEFRELASDFNGCRSNGTCGDCPNDNEPCEDTYILVPPCPGQTVLLAGSTTPIVPPTIFAQAPDPTFTPPPCPCTVRSLDVPVSPVANVRACYYFDLAGQRVRVPRGTFPNGPIVGGWPAQDGLCVEERKTCCSCIDGCGDAVFPVISNCYAPGPNACDSTSSSRRCCCSEEGTGRWSSSGEVIQYAFNFNGACDVRNRITWNWTVFYTRFRDAGGNLVENVTPTTLTFNEKQYAFLNGNDTRTTLVLNTDFPFGAGPGPNCFTRFGPAPAGVSVGSIFANGNNCPCELDVATLTNAANIPGREVHTWTHGEFNECLSGSRSGSASVTQPGSPCQFAATGTWQASWQFTPSGKCRGGCGQASTLGGRGKHTLATPRRVILPSSEQIPGVPGIVVAGGCGNCGNAGNIQQGFGP